MAKKRYVLVMKSGKQIPVTGVTGRYYVTREAQYRKGNPEIRELRSVSEEDCEKLIAAQEKKKRG